MEFYSEAKLLKIIIRMARSFQELCYTDLSPSEATNRVYR